MVVFDPIFHYRFVRNLSVGGVVALYEADAIFKGILIKLIQVFRNVYFKFSLVYSEFFIFIIGACLLFFIGYFLSNLIALFFCALTSFRTLLVLVFIGFSLMIFFVLFFPFVL